VIKTLPKQWRRQFVPAPDHARAVAGDLVPEGSIVDAVADALRRRTGVVVPAVTFDLSRSRTISGSPSASSTGRARSRRARTWTLA
jgi:hypothetical protein